MQGRLHLWSRFLRFPLLAAALALLAAGCQDAPTGPGDEFGDSAVFATAAGPGGSTQAGECQFNPTTGAYDCPPIYTCSMTPPAPGESVEACGGGGGALNPPPPSDPCVGPYPPSGCDNGGTGGGSGGGSPPPGGGGGGDEPPCMQTIGGPGEASTQSECPPPGDDGGYDTSGTASPTAHCPDTVCVRRDANEGERNKYNLAMASIDQNKCSRLYAAAGYLSSSFQVWEKKYTVNGDGMPDPSGGFFVAGNYGWATQRAAFWAGSFFKDDFPHYVAHEAAHRLDHTDPNINWDENQTDAYALSCLK